MQQIEPEISEKIELEHRDKSKIIAPFVTFGPSAFCWKEENRHLFNLNVWSELKFFNWDLDGKNRTPTNVETWFWTPRWLRIQPSVQSRTSNFWYMNQIKNFSIDSFSTFIEFSIDTLMGETKPIDLIQSFDLWQLQKESIEILMQQIEPEISEKIELEHRDKSKIIAPFVTFGPSAFCWKEENRHLFNLNVWSELKFFNWDLDGKNHASTNVETWYWKLRWLKTQPSVHSRTPKIW